LIGSEQCAAPSGSIAQGIAEKPVHQSSHGHPSPFALVVKGGDKKSRDFRNVMLGATELGLCSAIGFLFHWILGWHLLSPPSVRKKPGTCTRHEPGLDLRDERDFESERSVEMTAPKMTLHSQRERQWEEIAYFLSRISNAENGAIAID